MRRRYLCVASVGVLAAAAVLATGLTASAARSGSQAQPKRSIMRPLGYKSQKPARPTRTNNLQYRGGDGGIGVETAATV